MCLHKDLYITVHSSFMCNSLNLEITQNVHQQPHGYTVAYSYRRTPFSNKKEWAVETCISLHESQKLSEGEEAFHKIVHTG